VNSPLLQQAALLSLEQNLEASGRNTFLTAGRRQFRSLWTRDFCFAARGLSIAGHAEVAAAQFRLLLDHVREDGSVPRSFDGFSTKLRVCLAPVCSPPLGQKLHTEYLGEHGTLAFDSPPLLILEILRTGDISLREALEKKLPFLLKRARAFPMAQEAFTDWQDSARRTGPCFYLNILWWAAYSELEKVGLAKGISVGIREALKRFFVDSPLPRSSLHGNQLAFDGALLGLRYGFFQGSGARRSVWEALRCHPAWQARTGVPVSEPYAVSEISWTTRLVGLRSYHDSLSWTWLLGLALGAAREFGDEAEFDRIHEILVGSLDSSSFLAEVLDPGKKYQPFQSLLYRSECPFSWGAGLVVEGLA